MNTFIYNHIGRLNRYALDSRVEPSLINGWRLLDKHYYFYFDSSHISLCFYFMTD